MFDWLKIQDGGFSETYTQKDVDREGRLWTDRFMKKGAVVAVWTLIVSLPVLIVLEALK